jgi:DNA-binding XRE family transcriptional regulator
MEDKLTAHKFKIGESVDYIFAGRHGAVGVYEVTQLMPVKDDQLQYRIKSANEPHERRRWRLPSAFPRVNSAARSQMFARPLEASIGLEVRRLRKSIDLTLAELAAAARISPGMLSKIETGSTSPSLGTFNAVAKALNVPIKRLFPETFLTEESSLATTGRCGT